MAEVSTTTREGMSSVTRGTLLMLVGTLGFVGLSFVARVVLARSLTVLEWGQFSLGLALAGLLSSFGTLGLPQAVARCLPFAKSDDERRAFVHSALRVTAASAVVVTLGLLAFGLLLDVRFAAPTLALTMEFFAAAVGFSIAASIVASVFQGYEDVRPNALYLQVVNPALLIVFLLVGYQLTPVSLSYLDSLVAYLVANGVTLAAIAFYAAPRLRRVLPPGPRAEGVSRLLYLFAAPLFIVSVMAFVTGNADTLFLGYYHQDQVGYYTAALSLGRLLMVGIGSLSYIYLPVATRFIREGDTESVRLTYATATKWMTLISLPLFLLFYFLPGMSLSFVYGEAYSVSTLPLQVLVLGGLLSTLVGPSTSAQISFGQTRLLMYNTCASAATDVALAVVLIPSMGATGAAIAWAAANALNPILSAVELALLSSVHPFRSHYLVPVAGTGLPLALLFLATPLVPPFWALPGIVVGVAGLFVLVILVTGSVDRGDRLALEVVEGLLGRELTWLRRLGNWRLRHRLFGRG